MISGFKYAEISDGTTTITINKLLNSSYYNKQQLAKKDVDSKLKVIEEVANVRLITPDLANKKTLRSWMVNKTTITSIKIYGYDFRIDWLEDCKITLSNLIPVKVGNKIKLKINARLQDEALSNISVVGIP